MKVRLLGLSLVTLAVVLAGLYLLRDTQLSELRAVSPVTGLCLILLTILNVGAHVLAVSTLLRGMGYRRSVKTVYLVVTAGGTASYISNLKLGIPARIALYKRVLDIPITVGTASMALETAIWIGAMAVIMLLPANDGLLPHDWWLALGAVTGLVGILALFFFNLPRLDKLWEREGWFTTRTRGALAFVADFQKGMLSVRKATLVPVTALITLQYFIDALSIYLILREFGYEVDILSLSRVVVVSYSVGIVSMMPLGIGTRDASLAFLIMQLGMPNEIAVSCALIQRTVRLALPLAMGLVSANTLGIKFWKRGRADILPAAGSGPAPPHG